MVGIALQQHFLAIQFQTKFRAYLDGADTEFLAVGIGGCTILAQEGHLGLIEVRPVKIPQLWVGNCYFLQPNILSACCSDAADGLRRLAHHLPLWVEDAQTGFCLLGLSAKGCLYAYRYVSVVAGNDIERMPIQIKVAGSGH